MLSSSDMHMGTMRYAFMMLILVNVCIALWRSRLSTPWSSPRPLFTKPPEHKWTGYDYPFEYPIGDLDTVSMTLQESTHFSLNHTDPFAEQEWQIMTDHPKGYGRTRLGPEHRLFVVTFYHELHCLRQIQRALFSSDHPEATPHHIQHCFNYLRQNLLCDAADTLEKGDFMERDYEVDRVGDTLACHDWSKVYAELDRNFDEWSEWKAEWD